MLKHRVHHPTSGSTSRSGSQHDLCNDFPAPPPELTMPYDESGAQTHIQAAPQMNNINYNQQSDVNISKPSIVVQNYSNYSTIDGVDPKMAVKKPSEMETSPNDTNNAKKGIQIITEKYDRVGNLSPVSQTVSPLSSPSSEGTPFSFTDVIMSQKFREGVTESDLLQVDTFYRSHKSEVYVCGCLVNMYFGTAKSALMNDQWTFSSTGIPLMLLDTGEHHRERKLSILIAEKGTGFTLWRDVIDNLTGYRTPNANFHTMHISKDHTKLAGLSFDEAGAASEFYNHIKKLTADPEDELLKIGKSKKKKSVKDKKKKIKLPKKTEISNPCCFVHVTKLEPDKVAGIDNETSGSNKPSNSNEISAPFNFQHGTAPPGTVCGAGDVETLSTMVGSKMTLTSSSSIDSGLSEDRSST